MNSTYNVLISADLLNPKILSWDSCFNSNLKAKNPHSKLTSFLPSYYYSLKNIFTFSKAKVIRFHLNSDSWYQLRSSELMFEFLSPALYCLVYTKTKEFAFLLSLCNQINWSKKTSSAANKKYNERRCPTSGCSGFCKKYFLKDGWILCVLKISLTFNFSA